MIVTGRLSLAALSITSTSGSGVKGGEGGGHRDEEGGGDGGALTGADGRDGPATGFLAIL